MWSWSDYNPDDLIAVTSPPAFIVEWMKENNYDITKFKYWWDVRKCQYVMTGECQLIVDKPIQNAVIKGL